MDYSPTTVLPTFSDSNWTSASLTLRPYERPFGYASVMASAVILTILFVLGVLGNVLTIIVIMTSKRLKGVFNTFILSLCISDLSSAIISPLFLYRRTWGYNDWIIPSFFCKVYWSVAIWTSYVTAMHILAFAILRLISIRWAQAYTKITLKEAKICIAVMWTTGFVTGFIPFVLWFDAGQRPRNTNLPDARWPACTLEPEWSTAYSIYQKIAYSIFFFLPTLLITILTVVIGYLLYSRRNERQSKFGNKLSTKVEGKIEKSDRKEMEAMIQLSLIAGSFILGYLPFSAYEIEAMVTPSLTSADERYYWAFGMAEYVCLRISEALNPVFYNLASKKMRGETSLTLRKCFGICCGIKCRRDLSTPTTSSVGGGGLPTVKSLAASNDVIHKTSELPSSPAAQADTAV